MRSRSFVVIFLAAVVCLAPAAVFAKEHYRVVDKPNHFYYGYISFVEAEGDGKDPVVFREGSAEPVPAVVNLPLGPGDVIRTTAERRCEIQFDSATIVRLDVDTELKIETILAGSLSSTQELSNLFLTQGRIYVMYKEYSRREMFQVLTPAAAVKLKHKSVAMIKATADRSTDVQIKLGKASVLYGETESKLKREAIGKMDRLIVTGGGQAQVADYIGGTDFELWNEEVNSSFEELHEGAAVLPKPIQRLPRAVFHFAQNYGYRYGEWVWDDFFGYVWRPYLNDGRYPSGSWQPYHYGQWASYAGQMFWIPDEPWGWVPYHLGIWHWSKKLGWVWMPGSIFAPAWVDWDFFLGRFCWRPWTLWDWYWGGAFADSFFGPYYGPYGFGYWAGDWHYQWPGAVPADDDVAPPLDRIRKAQLKQPGSKGLPVPPELKGVLKKTGAAYERGDAWAVESMRKVPSHLLFLKAEDLGSRRAAEKSIKWDHVPRVKGIPLAEGESGSLEPTINPARRASLFLRGIDVSREIKEMPGRDAVRGPIKESRVPASVRGITQDSEPPRESATVPVQRRRESSFVDRIRARTETSARPRFLDWNPDVRVASRLGVSIEYSSRTNEVRSPELRLSSRDRLSPSRPVLSERSALSPAPGEAGSPGEGVVTPGQPGRTSSVKAESRETVSKKESVKKETIKK